MIIKRYRLYAEILNIILLSFIADVIYLAVAMAVATVEPMMFAVIAVTLAAVYITRMRITKLWLYLVLQIVWGLLLLLLPISLIGKVMSELLVVILFCSGIAYWKDDAKHGYYFVDAPFGFLFAAITIIAAYTHVDDLVVPAYRLGIAFIGVFLFRFYFENCVALYDERQIGESAPVKEMMHKGAKFVLPVAGGLSVFLFFADVEKIAGCVSGILGVIRDALVAILRWLVGKLVHPSDEINTISVSEEAQTFAGEATVLPHWVEVLINVTEYIVLIGGTCLILFLISRAVIRFFKEYYTRNMPQPHTVTTADHTDTIETTKKAVKSRKGLFYRMTNEEKVRYGYKKRVERIEKDCARKGDIKYSYVNITQTPSERADTFLKHFGIDYTEGTAIYERVRYGNKTVSDDDVKNVRR